MPIASSQDTNLQRRRRSKRPHSKVKTGCLTCRRRRVKCDENKPACRECTTRSLACAGYQQDRPWISYFVPTGTIGPNGGRSHVAIKPVNEEAQVSANESCLAHSVTSTIAWRGGLLDYLLVRWLPGTRAAIVPLGSWCVTAKDLADTSGHGILTQAMLTFSALLMSILEGDTRLHQGAIRGYQKVLAVLRSIVESERYRSRLKHDDKFLASLAASGFACAMVEYMLQTWHRSDLHLSGIEMMFRACGPSVLDNPTNRQIFFDHRIIWICCDFLHRRSSCYCTPEWQQFKWSDEDLIYNSPIHKLFTLASKVPPIMQRYDKIKACADSRIHEIHYSRCKQYLEDFETWKEDAITSGRLDLPIYVQQRTHPFSHEVRYSGTNAMMTHSYYSTLKILLLLEALESSRSIMNLQGSGSTFGISTKTDRLNFLCECEQEARSICQSAKSLMSDQGGFVKMPCTIFFIDTAWRAWEILERDADYDLTAIRGWFNDFDDFVTKQGFQMMRSPWRVTDKD